MCSIYFIYATDDKGNRRDDIEGRVFESPEHFTPEKPTCTCWIGDKEGNGKTLRQVFCEEAIQPFLKDVGWGNIVIEVR
jgi:hypothetical protein